jgi:hypothetical protein
MKRSLEYMGLEAGVPINTIKVDKVSVSFALATESNKRIAGFYWLLHECTH